MDEPKILCRVVEGRTTTTTTTTTGCRQPGRNNLLCCIVIVCLAAAPLISALDQTQIEELELKQACEGLFDPNGRPMEIGDVLQLLTRAEQIRAKESLFGNQGNSASSTIKVTRTCRDRLNILYNVAQVSGGNCHTKYLVRLEKMVDFYTVQERAIALGSFLAYYRAKQLAMCKQNSAGKELKRLVFRLNNECIDTVNHYLAALDDHDDESDNLTRGRGEERRRVAQLGDNVPMSRFVSALVALIENQRGSNEWTSFFSQPDPGYNLWQMVSASIGDSCKEVKQELGQHVDQLLGQFSSKAELESAMGPLTVKWIRTTIVCRSFLANMDRIFHRLFVELHAKLKIEEMNKSGR